MGWWLGGEADVVSDEKGWRDAVFQARDKMGEG